MTGVGQTLVGGSWWLCACTGLLLSACDSGTAAPALATSSPLVEAAGSEPIAPLPREAPFDQNLARLGEALFGSTVLSEDGVMSCASCHKPELGMADGRPLPLARARAAIPTNSTTLHNARYFAVLGWSGKFSTLSDHLNGLIQNPKLMGSSWPQLTGRLRADKAWAERFSAQFADGITEGNARAALIEYEKSLVTPDAPFDRWLRGDTAALPDDAKQGYVLFKSYGCASCHQGMLVGANLFQKLGVMRNYFAERPYADADLGRYNVTQLEEDRHVFRVPSLRNVSLTAPYLHDGSAATLPEAIAVMADAQLGIQLDAAETAQIIAFLDSLTGQYRGQPL